MKVNELRIGNIVSAKTQFGVLPAKVVEMNLAYCLVDLIDKKIAKGEWFGCKVDGGELKLIEPIPLTQEFFEKNGFIEQARCNEYGTYMRSTDLHTDVYEMKKSGGWIVHISDDQYRVVFTKCIKYVHELQNAYYLSTGKELEIKL